MRIKENEQYYTSLKKSIYDFKAYRHDLKHHFSTLKSMLYLKKYSEEIQNNIEEKSNLIKEQIEQKSNELKEEIKNEDLKKEDKK